VLAGGRGVRAVETLIFRAESESNFLELDLELQTLISTPHPPPRATATTVSFEHRERRTRHWRICAWTIGHNTEGWVAGGRSLTRVRVVYTPSRCRDGRNNKTIESHNTKAPVLKLSALTVTHHSTLCTSPTPYLKSHAHSPRLSLKARRKTRNHVLPQRAREDDSAAPFVFRPADSITHPSRAATKGGGLKHRKVHYRVYPGRLRHI
jgi:hypothetical protein